MKSKRFNNITDPFSMLQARIEALESRIARIDTPAQPTVPKYAVGSEPPNLLQGQVWIDDANSLRYRDNTGATRILSPSSGSWTNFTPHAYQPSSLTVTGTNCQYLAITSTLYYVRGRVDFDSSGTSNNTIYVGGNFPAPTFMDGTFVYFRQGVSWYQGYCLQDATYAQFVMQTHGNTDNLGKTPNFAVGTNDWVQFNLIMKV